VHGRLVQLTRQVRPPHGTSDQRRQTIRAALLVGRRVSRATPPEDEWKTHHKRTGSIRRKRCE